MKPFLNKSPSKHETQDVLRQLFELKKEPYIQGPPLVVMLPRQLVHPQILPCFSLLFLMWPCLRVLSLLCFRIFFAHRLDKHMGMRKGIHDSSPR